MNQREINIIEECKKFVAEKLKDAEKGHGYDHIQRVHNLAIEISKAEKTPNNQFIVELGALLHDIADWKFTGGDEEVAPRLASEWLKQQGATDEEIDAVVHIIRNISYKGAKVENKLKTIEGFIVQDADRLDALGAIGIARCFAYGGYKNRALYDPEIPPVLHETAEQYKNNNSPSLNHFYEKLFLLKDKMNTEAGKNFAQKRHDFMQQFVDTFLSEWSGKP
ncbi:metal-dependent phosphohydrolase (macronuclear) [Tetrahymena thermophila SB210]|uniref:Metal-dependent phosphohydrolase n=1 Tax=Tetrahymena thermophila (strain SB210) TaxID=312017 RepID=I7ML23_TETTS|nr:metal-dependent phosphohydrolase [Tetrahymena thermophila SB210]EAS00912.1 metal-dependent phosphohydrolase [Tetrahymena thermophila SB210]|eukprot:XP_001021158.1 metal-dependent phosphohydrolase [Tetrahymena thermophila SB210]